MITDQQMSELRISRCEIEESRWPTLHTWFWAAGVKGTWVKYRYNDVRTDEIVFVYEKP